MKNTRNVALFDLDGTLTYHDTLVPFLAEYLARHPLRLLGLGRLAPALLDYARSRDRGTLKSNLIRLAMGGVRREELRAYALEFVDRLQARGRLRPAGLAALEAHRAAGDRPVLLSASPDLYVPLIGERLGFERTLCTELVWRGERLDGGLKSENRRGEAKVRCLEWLRTQYPGMPIVAYGNSASDIPHLRRADRAVLVNAAPGARRLASALGIALADWR